ncbi:Trypsin-like peptidase domain [Phytophthora infestans]|uniref:Trypsin-like peptidase domain n=1 Tax=Phytophthora infestans TaxID=4787 RepID=A0A833T674_PHYIN|nr:Trypsin-like peptidase domain [Phytophthora infestans]
MEYPTTDELSSSHDDYVQIRAADPASTEKQVVQLRGGESSGDFYAPVLSTFAVIVELFTETSDPPLAVDASECLGFSVDSYQYLARASSLHGAKEEVCGFDKSREASCYKSFTDAFQASKTVARLLIKKPEGAFYCTGWLLGSEGHLMTNHHCISSQTHADNTEFEFNAGGSVCSISCTSARACSGSIRAKSAALIYADEALDYALLKLPAGLSVEYGYLRLRASGAVLSERIFMPQHPAGWGKRIAMKTDSGWRTVKSLTMDGCATDQVAYYLDTQGGSSGSPVLSWQDNTVIALHHCGGCPNTAINSYKLVNDMK